MTNGDHEQLAWQAMEAGNYVAALPLLKVLAERNSEYALLSLGWIYETGVLGAPDKTAARSFYEHAAQVGSAEAYGRLGLLLRDEGKEEQAETAFKQGAQLGDDDFKPRLERIADSGQEQRAHQSIEAGNYEEALRLLEPLGARNSVYALLTLGGLYETGKLGAPAMDVARSYYDRAAKQGSAEANRRVGQILLDQGEEKQARSAFKHGAEAGNISCMYWLGKMMLEGRGGPVEINRGTEWLEAAAAQGHIYAKRKLLVVERTKASSIFRKLLINGRIVVLAKDLVKELLKDLDSDKVR